MNNKAQQAIAKVREFGPDKLLLVGSGLLILLLVLQGVRYGFAARLGKGLVDSLTAREAEAAERKDAKSLENYKPITDKGILGAAPGKPSPQKLFGIMGDMALIGTSDNAKPYTVGADIPGGEKLVEVAADYVLLQKDGNQRKELVFPVTKGKPGRVVELPAGGRPSGPPRGQQPPQPQAQQVTGQPAFDQEQAMRIKMEQAQMQAEQAKMEAERASAEQQQPRRPSRGR